MTNQPTATALVPDPQVQEEFGICAMTIWRWDRDPEMLARGWPLPVKIRKRNYRPRHLLELFKLTMVKRSAVDA
jgi:hypothetical protein